MVHVISGVPGKGIPTDLTVIHFDFAFLEVVSDEVHTLIHSLVAKTRTDRAKKKETSFTWE